MKKIILLLFCFFISTSQANFVDAQKNYTQGNFKQAFDAFLTMAKLGNIKSQHNVAIMFSKGQGVEKDLIHAYAWEKIATQQQADSPLINHITKQIKPVQLTQAQALFSKLMQSYSTDAIKNKFAPNYQPAKISQKKESSNKNLNLKNLKTFAPKYPRGAALKGIQGLVDLGFNVYTDGSVRDIYIINSFPKNVFEKEAVKAVTLYKFDITPNQDNPNQSMPYQTAKQFIMFRLSNKGSMLNSKQILYLKQQSILAQKGNLNAQKSLTSILNIIPAVKETTPDIIPKKQEIEWLYNLAQHGVAESQYLLAINLYYGEYVEQEPQKGINWLSEAANSGLAEAQNLLYYWLQNPDIINTSGQTKDYWLEQAIKNGSNNAKLQFAKQAIKQDKSHEQLELALTQLDDYGKFIGKTPQFYQIKALLLDKMGHYSNAKSQIKIALKYAKKAGWNLTELQAQKEMIQKHKKNKKFKRASKNRNQ